MLLHALVAMTPTEFQLNLDEPQVGGNADEETVPVTSQLCQWKRPKKRKESNLRMSDAKFERHDYSRSTKRQIVPVEDFDPRPQEFRGTAGENLPSLIEAVHGQGLCISLLLDTKCRCFTDSIPTPSTAPTLPSLPPSRILLLLLKRVFKHQKRKSGKSNVKPEVSEIHLYGTL